MFGRISGDRQSPYLMGISWFLSHHLRRAWHAYDRSRRITAATSNNVHRLINRCRHRRNSLPCADTDDVVYSVQTQTRQQISFQSRIHFFI